MTTKKYNCLIERLEVGYIITNDSKRSAIANRDELDLAISRTFTQIIGRAFEGEAKSISIEVIITTQP